MATLKDTLVLGKLTVVDKIVKSGGLPTSILTGDGSMASVGSRADSTATTGNSGQIYLVQRNAAGQLVVDVPWSAGSGDVVATSVAGSGIIKVTQNGSTYTVSHNDTSTAESVDGKIINKVTIDGYGHVTALGYTTIDLGSYVTGSGLAKDEIVLGNAGTAIRTSGYYIQTSFDGGANKIPTSGAIKTWVEDKGYGTGNITGSSLNANNIIVGNGGSAIKDSGCSISTIIYDQDGDAGEGSQGIPNVHAVASYVLGKGYLTSVSWNDITNKPTIPTIPTDNVTGSGLDSNEIILGNGLTSIKSSGKTISTSISSSSTNSSVPTSSAVVDYVDDALNDLNLSSNDDAIYTYNASTGVLTINSGDSSNVGAAGTYTPSYSSNTLKVYEFTVNSGGRVTGATEKSFTVTGGSGNITDTNYYYKPRYTSGINIAYEANGNSNVKDLFVPMGTTASTAAWGNHTHSNYLTSNSLSGYATQAWVTEHFEGKTCFVPGTLITMADGSRKVVEEIKAGDLLMSYDLENKKFVPAVCLSNSPTRYSTDLCRFYFEDGTKVSILWEHDFFDATRDVWVEAHDGFDVGHEVIKEDGSRLKFLGSLQGRLPKAEYFYDLTTSNNCYIAQGIVFAHNPVNKRHWGVDNSDAPEILKQIMANSKDEHMRESDILEDDEYCLEYLKDKMEEKEISDHLERLKIELQTTDYVALKEREGYKRNDEIMEARIWWRKVYNEREKELKEVSERMRKRRIKYSKLKEDVDLPLLDLRRKFLYDSNKEGNEHLQEFIEYYKNKERKEMGENE